MLAVTAGEPPASLGDGCVLADAIRRGQWSGRASQLSEDHVEWTFIDEIARATEGSRPRDGLRPSPNDPVGPPSQDPCPLPIRDGLDARQLILQRRSALAFDGHSSIDAEAFFAMLSRVMPGPQPPWDALWWDARIHLALFVHRVDGVDPGLYCAAARSDGRRAISRPRAAASFSGTAHRRSLPLVLPGARRLPRRSRGA